MNPNLVVISWLESSNPAQNALLKIEEQLQYVQKLPELELNSPIHNIPSLSMKLKNSYIEPTQTQSNNQPCLIPNDSDEEDELSLRVIQK